MASALLPAEPSRWRRRDALYPWFHSRGGFLLLCKAPARLPEGLDAARGHGFPALFLNGQGPGTHDRHPQPGEVALVVEVADASLRRDRGAKKRLYARASLPIYWIVNLRENRIEVYTDPTGQVAKPDYRQRQFYGPDDELPLVLDGREISRIPVHEILP